MTHNQGVAGSCPAGPTSVDKSTCRNVGAFIVFGYFQPDYINLMAVWCYILYSKNLDKFYVGATHDSVGQRLDKHNQHSYGNHRFTAKADDWEVFITIEADDYAHAVRMERKIKSMKSKNYILNLKQYPELRQKLISQTGI